MAIKKAKKTAKKTVKNATKAINKENIQNIQTSLTKMKDNAMDINNQLTEMATEIVKDLRENSDGLKDVANKSVNLAKDKVNDTIGKVTEKVTMDNIKTGLNTANKYTLKTAEELVDGAIENGAKWQKVGDKAVKGSLKLAEKQTEIVFDTLEVVKGQLGESASRLRKILFSKN